MTGTGEPAKMCASCGTEPAGPGGILGAGCAAAIAARDVTYWYPGDPEDAADAEAAREGLAEIEAGARPVPASEAWRQLGLGGSEAGR